MLDYTPCLEIPLIPEEVDLVIRNDNAGENSFDNIEIFSDTDADLYFIISKTALLISKKADNLRTLLIQGMGSRSTEGNSASRKSMRYLP